MSKAVTAVWAARACVVPIPRGQRSKIWGMHLVKHQANVRRKQIQEISLDGPSRPSAKQASNTEWVLSGVGWGRRKYEIKYNTTPTQNNAHLQGKTQRRCTLNPLEYCLWGWEGKGSLFPQCLFLKFLNYRKLTRRVKWKPIYHSPGFSGNGYDFTTFAFSFSLPPLYLH